MVDMRELDEAIKAAKIAPRVEAPYRPRDNNGAYVKVITRKARDK